jgi:hypothetical protein
MMALHSTVFVSKTKFAVTTFERASDGTPQFGGPCRDLDVPVALTLSRPKRGVASIDILA